MKKLLILAFALLTLTGCRYVALGDSIGYGPESYAGQLAERGGEAVEYDNLAVPGEYLPLLLYRLEHEPELREAIGAAGLLTVSIGANDLLWAQQVCGEDRACLDGYQANIERAFGELAGVLRGIAPAARIVLLEIYQPFDLSPDLASRLEAVNAAINAAACGQGIAVAHIAGMPRELLAADGLHPSREGGAWIADAVLASKTCEVA